MAKDKTKPKAEFPIDPSEFLHHPHDRYVRFAMQIRDLAMEFLQFSLDTRTKALIDWDSLQISKESYIDEKLKAHYSDICYTGLMHSKEPIRIATLIEHKSDPPRKGELTVQLNRYILNLWIDDLNHSRPLTLTIPIVLYHGNTTLAKETTKVLFSGAPDWLHGFVPSFDYILVDLSKQTEASLESLQMLYLGKFLTALKHSRDDDYIAFYWKKFVIFAPNQYDQIIMRQFSVATVLYLNATSTVFNKKIKNMDNLLTTEEKAGVKPYLFELLDQKKEEGRAEGLEKGRKEGIEKGREEGMEKGREEGMEKGREEGMENTIRLFLIKNPNWTDQQVAECFEVTIEFVGKIRDK